MADEGYFGWRARRMHREYIPTSGKKLHPQNLHMMGLLMERIHRLIGTFIRSGNFFEGRIKKEQSVSQQTAPIMFIYFNCNENIQLLY